MNAATIDPWLDSLFADLLAGVPPNLAVAKAAEAGIDEQVATALAREAVASPFFDIAHRYWIRAQSREWWLGARAALAELRGERGTIDANSAVSRADFLDRYYSANRPLFMPGVARTWAAVKLWTPRYLSATCGDEIIEVMMNRSGAPTKDQNVSSRLKTKVAFREYIELVHSTSRSNDFYMVSRNRFFEHPGTSRLLGDLGRLDCVRTDAAGEDIKMWFGPAGTVTPLHHDDRNNVVVQIRGSKQVRLFSPLDSPFMHQTQWWFADTDPGLQSNEARSGRFPAEIRLRLTPGDALFIPVGWWHAIEAEDISITLAFVDFGVPNQYPMVP